MLFRRRTVLQFGGAIVTAAVSGGVAKASPSPRRSTPRYFVHLVLFGGIDAVLTTAPRERSEVDRDIDVPYEKNAIIGVGDRRFGPHFGPLAKWSSQMTVLNSVFVGTANHPAGGKQLSRLRMGATEAMPMAIDIIGSRRDTQALPAIALGMRPLTNTGVVAPHAIDPTVFKAADSATPDELALLADVTRRQVKTLGVTGATKENVADCATFFERLASTSRFKMDMKWPSLAKADGPEVPFARDMQRTLWLIENDLTRSVLMAAGDWDSHGDNISQQAQSSGTYFPVVSDFLAALQSRPSRRGGTLLDETVVLVSSEIGRYPVLNRAHGKDHFPELPVMLFGAVGGKGQTFGRPGRRMQALPVSKKTGKDTGGAQGRPTLDDLGATLLRLFDVDPTTCGYDGDTLEFLGV